MSGAPAVHWREDGLRAARQRARTRGCPLLVWWTASWCPPCNDLRLSVFDSAAFAGLACGLELLQLDGDVPGTQQQGEALGVSFYPSVLLLDADGRELLRLGSGWEAEAFCAQLRDHLRDAEPVTVRLARLHAGQGGPADATWLAIHSWSLDRERLEPLALRSLLEQAMDLLPASTPEALALALHLLQAHEWDGTAPSDTSRHRLASVLAASLASTTLCFFDLYLLALRPDRLQVVASGDALHALQQQLRHVLEALESDPRWTPTQQLTLLHGQLRLDAGGHDAALRARACAAVNAFDRQLQGDDARLTALNMAADLLLALGDVEAAAALLEREAAGSVHAPYLLQARAGIAEQQGDLAGAAAWTGRAWAGTPPGAIRVARGVRHLRALDRQPDAPEFASVLDAVMTGLALQPDPQAGNHRRYLADLLALLEQRARRHAGEAA